jgi:hypothetical protein
MQGQLQLTDVRFAVVVVYKQRFENLVMETLWQVPDVEPRSYRECMADGYASMALHGDGVAGACHLLDRLQRTGAKEIHTLTVLEGYAEGVLDQLKAADSKTRILQIMQGDKRK